MKIVHIIEATNAGVGRHVLDLAGAQARRDHQVHVVYSPTRESDAFWNERTHLANVQWHSVPLSRAFALADFKSIARVRRIVKTIDPDVVHGHSTKGGIVARIIGGRLVAYTPNAVYSMNPELGRSARTAVMLAERVLSVRTDLIFAVSPEEQEHLREIGVAEHKLRLVPNGIAPYSRSASPSLREELGVGGDVKIAGFVGRLDLQKGPERLVPIFEAAFADHPEIHGAIVGDGPLREELERAVAAEPGLRDRIHMVGQRPGRWAMESMDVFVLPSRYEGFPYVLIEAAQAGVPLVTTTGACASQLIVDEEVGAVHDREDIEGMAASVVRLATSGSERRAETLREIASDFTIEAMTDGVMKQLWQANQ
jgi:glycosyltransferase involved in cell wall biosynthesis